MKTAYKLGVVLVIVALVQLCAYNFNLTYTATKKLVDEQIEVNLSALEKQVQLFGATTDFIMGVLDSKNLGLARSLAAIIDEKTRSDGHGPTTNHPSTSEMQNIADMLMVSETVVIDHTGHIVASNRPDYLNYEMAAHPQSRAFNAILADPNLEIVQEPQPNGRLGLWYQYVGVPLKMSAGYVQVGNDLQHLQEIQNAIALQRNIEASADLQSNYIFVVKDGRIQAYPDRSRLNQDVRDEDWYQTIKGKDGFAFLEVFNDEYYAGYRHVSGSDLSFVSMIPRTQYDKKLGAIKNSALLVLALATIFLAIIWFIISRMNRAIREAQQANRAKGAFLANMSHEIRTPMNGIIGFAELAMNDRKVPDRTREYLRKIKSSADGLLYIINDILDISKIEAGAMELESIPFTLVEVFEQCETISQPRALLKGVTLSLKADPIPGRDLLGDPNRLRQIILNLLSNAIKFTQDGSVTATAHILAVTPGSIAVGFEIRDTGIGMTEEQIQRIFDPFSQADSSITRKFGGTGLGLTITKNLIDLMGGTLSVTSTPGSGSLFSFVIPFTTIFKASHPANNADPARTAPSAPAQPYFRGHVLVCEDNPINQEVIAEHLSRVGISCSMAENGAIGLQMVEEAKKKNAMFDLVFMDIHMPVMDGLETTKRIRELGVNIPIVALTANVMTHNRDEYITRGMAYCLGKPFNSVELWECLLRYMKPVRPPSDTGIYEAVPPASGPSASARPGGDSLADGAESRLLDTKIGLERSANNQKLYNQLLAKFVRDNHDYTDKIQEALAKKDGKNAHLLAHTLKSVAGTLGALRLSTLASQMECTLLSEAPAKEVETILGHMRAVLQNTIAAIKKLPDVQQKLAESNRVSAPSSVNSATPPPPPADPVLVTSLSGRLRPLLESGNVDCLSLLEQVNTVYPDTPDRALLTRQMEDFDFDHALATLERIANPPGAPAADGADTMKRS